MPPGSGHAAPKPMFPDAPISGSTRRGCPLIDSFERRGFPHTGVVRHTPAWSPVQSQRARRTCTSTEDRLVHRRDKEVNNATRHSPGRSVRLDHSLLTTSKFGVVARRRAHLYEHDVFARRVAALCPDRPYHGTTTVCTLGLSPRASWRLVWLVCAWT